MRKQKITIHNFVRWIFLGVFIGGITGCDLSHPKKHRATSSRNILAQVGPNIITRKDLQQVLESMPTHIRRQYAISLSRKKRLLWDLIQFEVLVLEAQRQGLQKSRDVKKARERAMVHLLIKRIVQKVRPISVSDEEIALYYRKNFRVFNRAERRRVSQIAFRLPATASIEEKKKKEASIQKLFPLIQAANKKNSGFAEMARKYSEDQISRKKGGDIGYSVSTEKGGHWNKHFSHAAFQLKKIGEIVGPIQTQWGYFIIRLEEIVPPLSQSLTQVRSVIRNRLLEKRRKVVYNKYLLNLRKHYKVTIDEKLLMNTKSSRLKPTTQKASRK